MFKGPSDLHRYGGGTMRSKKSKTQNGRDLARARVLLVFFVSFFPARWDVIRDAGARSVFA